MSCGIEGHPDNVAPAIYGGIQVEGGGSAPSRSGRARSGRGGGATVRFLRTRSDQRRAARAVRLDRGRGRGRASCSRRFGSLSGVVVNRCPSQPADGRSTARCFSCLSCCRFCSDLTTLLISASLLSLSLSLPPLSLSLSFARGAASSLVAWPPLVTAARPWSNIILPDWDPHRRALEVGPRRDAAGGAGGRLHSGGHRHDQGGKSAT